MGQINSYLAKTTPTGTDEFIFQETGGGTTKKITHTNLVSTIQSQIDDIIANPVLPKNYIQGLEISNDTDTDHDIQIDTGSCKDSTGAYDFELSSALTKQIDAVWAAGDDAGGLDTGSVAADTWYYIWLIRKDSDASIDALFSTSATSPTMPGGYTYKRRIRGAVLTDGSANIYEFFQKDNEFRFVSKINDYTASTVGTSRVLVTVAVPPNFLGVINFQQNNTNTLYTNFGNTNEPDVVPTSTNFDIYINVVYNSVSITSNILIDASSQIYFRSTVSTGGALRIFTKGFIDPAQD